MGGFLEALLPAVATAGFNAVGGVLGGERQSRRDSELLDKEIDFKTEQADLNRQSDLKQLVAKLLIDSAIATARARAQAQTAGFNNASQSALQGAQLQQTGFNNIINGIQNGLLAGR